MPSFFTFLWATFLVGTFSFGGGKAQIPVYHNIYVDKFNIISNIKLTEVVGYSIALPGPLSPKITGAIAFEQYQILGFILGLLALSVFPLLLFFFTWGLYKRYSDNERVISISNYFSPAIIALLLSVCYSLFIDTRPSDNADYTYDIYFFIVFIISTVTLFKTKIHPVVLIMLSGIIGYFLL